MSAGREAVRMSEDQIREFLRTHRKVQLATVGRAGAPHLTTLFYVLDDEGRVTFWTYGRSQKVKNVERNPQVSCLIEDGDEYATLRGVSLTGTAEVVWSYDRVIDVGRRVAAVMTGAAAYSDDEIERQARKRVAVVIHPERVASWDHRLLPSLGANSS